MHMKVVSASLAASVLGRAIAEVPCLTAENCQARGKEVAVSQDLQWFTPGDYPTKGCFSKGVNLFFSPGTIAEMTAPIPQELQKRLWCNSTVDGPVAHTLGNAAPCLTKEECRRASKARNIPNSQFHTDDSYATKGCYEKNGKAFFSKGTAEEMATVDLTGILERIFCDDGALSNEAGGTGSVTESGGDATDGELEPAIMEATITADEGTGAAESDAEEPVLRPAAMTPAPAPATPDTVPVPGPGDPPADPIDPQVPSGNDVPVKSSDAPQLNLGMGAIGVVAVVPFFF